MLGWLVILTLLLYFIFIRKGRYLSIYKNYKDNPKINDSMVTMFTIVYIAFSILSPFAGAIYLGKHAFR
jgi:hypothetical protein